MVGESESKEGRSDSQSPSSGQLLSSFESTKGTPRPQRILTIILSDLAFFESPINFHVIWYISTFSIAIISIWSLNKISYALLLDSSKLCKTPQSEKCLDDLHVL